MLQAIVVVLLLLMSLAGCSNEYDLCIERQREEYRQRNPKASYGQMQSKQFEFEMLCSSYKKK
jgi:hypothetical protein